MPSLQDILTNIAILLGADEVRAAQDMHDVIAFEIELSLVRIIHCSGCEVSNLIYPRL